MISFLNPNGLVVNIVKVLRIPGFVFVKRCICPAFWVRWLQILLWILSIGYGLTARWWCLKADWNGGLLPERLIMIRWILPLIWRRGRIPLLCWCGISGKTDSAMWIVERQLCCFVPKGQIYPLSVIRAGNVVCIGLIRIQKPHFPIIVYPKVISALMPVRNWQVGICRISVESWEHLSKLWLRTKCRLENW